MTQRLFSQPAIPNNAQSRFSNTLVYGKTMLIDFDTGQFFMNPDGTFIVRDDKSGFTNLVRKALVTVRNRFGIYDHTYGCSIERLIGKNLTHEELKSEVERLIIDALIYDPRIMEVRDFTVEIDGDDMEVSFTYVDVWGNTQNLEIKY